MKTIAIYEDSKEKVVYVSSLKMCYKKASNGTIFEMDLADANGAYVDTIRVDQLNMYNVGEEEQQIIINEMDKMVQENADFIYQEYGSKSKDEQKPSTLDKKLEPKKPYKIYFDDFIKSDKPMAIHVNNEEEAIKVVECKNKARNVYSDNTAYDVFKEETCYSNNGSYCSRKWYIDNGYTIYDFSEVCFEPKKKGGK